MSFYGGEGGVVGDKITSLIRSGTSQDIRLNAYLYVQWRARRLIATRAKTRVCVGLTRSIINPLLPSLFPVKRVSYLHLWREQGSIRGFVLDGASYYHQFQRPTWTGF